MRSKEEFERILGSKVKKTISIWEKPLLVAALRGSFAIWLKKCGTIPLSLKDPLALNQG
jgi:hypothetical protein